MGSLEAEAELGVCCCCWSACSTGVPAVGPRVGTATVLQGCNSGCFTLGPPFVLPTEGPPSCLRPLLGSYCLLLDKHWPCPYPGEEGGAPLARGRSLLRGEASLWELRVLPSAAGLGSVCVPVPPGRDGGFMFLHFFALSFSPPPSFLPLSLTP